MLPIETTRELGHSIQLLRGHNGIERPSLFAGMQVYYTPTNKWMSIIEIDASNVVYTHEGKGKIYSVEGWQQGLYHNNSYLLPGEDYCPPIPKELHPTITTGDIICWKCWIGRDWHCRPEGGLPYRSDSDLYEFVMKVGGVSLQPKQIDTSWNCKCPRCGMDAYMGFIKIECSNLECK